MNNNSINGPNIFQRILSFYKKIVSKVSVILKQPLVKLFLLIIAFLFPFIVSNDYVIYICVVIMITSISILGYNFMTGFSGTFIMSQAAFCGLGAYMSVYAAMHWGIPIIICFIIGALFSSLIGFLLSFPTKRLSSVFLSLATLGFNQLMYIIFQNATNLTGGAYGIKDIPRPVLFGRDINNKEYYILSLIFLIISYFAIKRILLSKTGRVMLAIAVDPMVPASVGVNTGNYRTLAFCVASFFGGLSGALQAHFINYIFANNYKSDETMIQLSMMALGGMASLPGSIVGTAIFNFISYYFAALYNYRLFICGGLLVLTMLFRPQGIMGGKPIGLRKHTKKYLESINIKPSKSFPKIK